MQKKNAGFHKQAFQKEIIIIKKKFKMFHYKYTSFL